MFYYRAKFRKDLFSDDGTRSVQWFRFLFAELNMVKARNYARDLARKDTMVLASVIRLTADEGLRSLTEKNVMVREEG